MTAPPSISGSSGMSMPLADSPRRSSQMATTTATTTITMKAGFQKNREAAIAERSTTAEPTAALRARPARPWSFGGAGVGGVSVMEVERAGSSDLEQLGLLVLEHLVDGVGVVLGEGVEPLLGAGDVVLADLAVLLELLEALLGG